MLVDICDSGEWSVDSGVGFEVGDEAVAAVDFRNMGHELKSDSLVWRVLILVGRSWNSARSSGACSSSALTHES